MATLYFNAKVFRFGKPFACWFVVDERGLLTEIGNEDEIPISNAIIVCIFMPHVSFSLQRSIVVVCVCLHLHQKKINLRGHLVFPGFHESHIHIFLIGSSMHQLNCVACNSIAELQLRLKQFVPRTSPGDTIFGFGWMQDNLSRMPTKEDLDAIVNDRPVLLYRGCYHVAVLNSAALQACDLSSSSVNPVGGIFDRVPGSNELTGVVREKALDLCEKILQTRWTPADKVRFLRAGMTECVRNGITAVQTNDDGCYPLYQALSDQQLLPIRS